MQTRETSSDPCYLPDVLDRLGAAKTGAPETWLVPLFGLNTIPKGELPPQLWLISPGDMISQSLSDRFVLRLATGEASQRKPSASGPVSPRVTAACGTDPVLWASNLELSGLMLREGFGSQK